MTGMLVRLGKGQDGWALDIDGVTPMYSGSRRMQGWVRAAPSVTADAVIRRRVARSGTRVRASAAAQVRVGPVTDPPMCACGARRVLRTRPIIVTVTAGLGEPAAYQLDGPLVRGARYRTK